jgi:hypothetical protein
MPVLRRLSMAALVALSVALVSGCERRYEFPNVLYPPTVVGVIETASLDGRGWHVTLVDGRVRDLLEVMNAHGLTGHGGQTDAGNLFLEGAADDGVWWVLMPALGDGCWEAYGNPSSNPMVWDTGSSIVFMDGLELPKAAGFWAEVQPRGMGSRLGWLQPEGDVFEPSEPTSYCVNARGEVEFAVLEWTGQRPSPPPSA